MTVHYISQTEITLEKYLHWANNPIGKNAVKKLTRYHMINGFAMVFSLAGGLFCFRSDITEMAWLYMAFFIAFGYKLLFARNISNKKLYNQSIAAMDGEKWIRTITFASNIQVADNNSTTTFKYSDFKKVDENSRYYLLYRDENLVLRVDKGSFITGEELQFKAFIASRIKNKI